MPAACPLQAIAQNRVQQIVITLDKVKHFLRQPGQLQVRQRGGEVGTKYY